MHSRSLTRLLVSPAIKLTWSQIKRIKQSRPNTKNLHSSTTKHFDTVKNLPYEQKAVSKEVKVSANGFSTSTNHNFWKKLTSSDQQQLEVSAQLYAHEAEVQPLLAEGVGWAGQPIVRRKHPILPEVYGDMSDVFTAVEKLPGHRNVHEEALSFSENNGGNGIISHTARLQEVNLEVKEGSPKNPQCVKGNLVDTNKAKEETEVTLRSSDGISDVVENLKSGLRENIHSKEADSIPSRSDTVKGNGEINTSTGGQSITHVGFITKKTKRLKNMKNTQSNSGLVLIKQKKKSKKKTKVCSSKAIVPLMSKTKIKKSKKKKVSMLGVNKKRSVQLNVLLGQRASAQPTRKNVMILTNRQIQTFSHKNQAKLSISVKERSSATIIALAKKQNKTSKLQSDGKYPEDCKCPETIETKSRFPTKICGEAAGAGMKKKKKEWKGKMCPVEHKPKYRRRTFVCNSAKFGKAKRKRQLPKCVKPEKKVASRVLVCPPVLEDELEKLEKKCVRQVEEVKVRSRTKVCKPIIVYQIGEAKVIAQKSVCTEKKVKKIISRHTKVCPPSENTSNTSHNKKSKR